MRTKYIDDIPADVRIECEKIFNTLLVPNKMAIASLKNVGADNDQIFRCVMMSCMISAIAALEKSGKIIIRRKR